MNDRIEIIRKHLVDNNLDVFLVLSNENRRYLTGFTGSNGIVLISKNNCFLMTDSRYTEQAEKEAQAFEIITYNLSPFEDIGVMLKKWGLNRVGYESKLVTDFQIRQFKKLDTRYEWIPTEDVVLELRSIKTKEEIACIKKAAEIGDQSFSEMIKTMKAGMTERDLMVELEYRMRKNGSEGSPFSIIVASGKRSSLPHGLASTKRIEKGDMVTIDFGATWNGYMSDMTRTIWVGEPEKRMQDIFKMVDEAMVTALGSIEIGKACKEIDEAHRNIFREYGVEPYSLRGLGHGVGLQIHEFPRVVMHNEALLEANMVFTIEPGLYIPDVGGVRTEDTVVLTESGVISLMKTPKKIVVE